MLSRVGPSIAKRPQAQVQCRDFRVLALSGVALDSVKHRWSQPVNATLYLKGEVECMVMGQRFHRGFTAAEKTELWDRWKRGESLIEREHQWPAETVLSEGHRLVGALASLSEQSGSSAK